MKICLSQFTLANGFAASANEALDVSVTQLYSAILSYCIADRAGLHTGRSYTYNASDAFVSGVRGLLSGLMGIPVGDTMDKELSEAIDAWVEGGMTMDAAVLLRRVVASLTDWLDPLITVETMSAEECMKAIGAAQASATDKGQGEAFMETYTAAFNTTFLYSFVCQLAMEFSCTCTYAATYDLVEFVEKAKCGLDKLALILPEIVELAEAESNVDTLKVSSLLAKLTEEIKGLEEDMFYDDGEFEKYREEYVKELAAELSTEKKEEKTIDLSKVAKLLAAGVATVIAVRTVTKTAKLVIGVPAALAFAPQILQTLNRLVFHRFF